VPWFHGSSRPSIVNEEFFYYRSLQLSSGISPTLPIGILLIALLVWCVTSLRALHQLSYQPDWVSPVWKFQFQPFAEKLNDLRFGPLGKPESWVIGLLIVVPIGIVVLVFRLRSAFSVVEKGNYDLVCLLGFSVSACLLFGALASVWRHLQTVLVGLAHLPIRHAFSRLPRDFYVSLTWGHAGKTGDPFESTLAVWSATLECLKRLKFMLGMQPPSARACVFNRKYDALMNKVEKYGATQSVPLSWTSIFEAIPNSVAQPAFATNGYVPDGRGIREQPTRLRVLRGEGPRSANCL
jgi:hypothetical protein